MRLSADNQEIIRRTAAEVFGARARVRVFGSRVDDQAKGGDLDLLVESDEPIEQSARKSLQLVARLQMRMGDQSIDVLVVDPKTVLQPVHKSALQYGVLL